MQDNKEISLIELFRNGASLHIWRNSTPHNMWLSTDTNDISLSRKEYEELKLLASHSVISPQKVSYGSFIFARSDNGSPIMEGHYYNEPTEKQRERVLKA